MTPLLVGAACCSAPALAEDSNADRLCSEQPGLTTSACITAPGRLQAETALATWTRQGSNGERDDMVVLGDTLLRYGVCDRVELRLGWTPYGIDRDRDADGLVTTTHRVGDVSLGLKSGLVERKGDNGLAVSAIVVASVPTGRRPIGAGKTASRRQGTSVRLQSLA